METVQGDWVHNGGVLMNHVTLEIYIRGGVSTGADLDDVTHHPHTYRPTTHTGVDNLTNHVC